MIKRFLIISALATSLVTVHADLVLKQHVDGQSISGTVTTQIKGNKIRVDMPATPQGAVSRIIDLNSGDSVTLLPRQKIAMKIPGSELKQMAEKLKKERAGAGRNASPPTFHDTGKSEKVGRYNTEMYRWSSPAGETQTVWVAKNYPNYAKIKDQMDKLNNSPVGRMAKGSTPDVSTLPGMVVKTQTEMNGQKITSTLISVKEEPVNASIFEIPKDYQQMSRPSARPAPNQ